MIRYNGMYVNGPKYPSGICNYITAEKCIGSYKKLSNRSTKNIRLKKNVIAHDAIQKFVLLQRIKI